MNSARSIVRLELARKLEHLPKGADMRLHIRMLPSERREHLRALVDWVQDYEKHQRKFDDGVAAAVKAAQERRQKLVQPLRGAHGG